MSATNGRQSADRVSDDDLERHRRMLARLQEIQLLQQHAAQLQARASDLSAAVRIWAEELHERYHLNAAIGEGVLPDGTIIRQSAPAISAREPDSTTAESSRTAGPTDKSRS